jgi:ubiquinone/menaquinone biosynthesis C-methylase UbiE
MRRSERTSRHDRIGRAYDMAREIARHLPPGARVLDVGCGNGFIAHHLSAMMGVPAEGVDVGCDTEAPIRYRSFEGETLPFSDGSFDVVLFCYVLHHARDAPALLAEARRVLRSDGRVVIYEDTPRSWIDRLLCWRHQRQWIRRTGPCTFRRDDVWRSLFSALGFDLILGRALSRARDLGHPVARSFYCLGRPALPPPALLPREWAAEDGDNRTAMGES